MSDTETIKVYDARAKDYAALNQDYLSSDPRLAAFIAACPANGRVLDLGCGPGTSAGVMAEAGLMVDATDASAEMTALAAQIDGVNAWQARFDEISGDGIYDGIWANFSLLHAPRSDMPRHLQDIHRALKPNGAFYIALKLGKGEARDTIGRLYTYYEEDELIDLLTTAGFTPLDRSHGKGPGLDGSVSHWISVANHG